MSDSTTVLEQHELFRTTDPSTACARNSAILRRHSLRVIGDGPPFEAVHCAAGLGTMSVHRWSFGAAVEISATRDAGADAYLVTVPCRGRIVDAEGRGRADAGVIANPFRPFSACWSPGCVALTVRIESAVLARHLASVLQRPVATGPVFGPVFDLRGPGRAWVRLVRAWIELAEVSPTRLGRAPMAAAIEQSLMTGLLVAGRHDFSEALLGADTTPAPLRRVLERVERDPGAVGTVVELAAAAGLSVRALQDNFARYLSTTPTAYVRETRLRRAHADLLAADPADRGAVGVVARRWGFGNLGRFAREYRTRFGRRPAQTLREPPGGASDPR